MCRDLHRELKFLPGYSLFFLNYSPTLVLGYTPHLALLPGFFLCFLPSFLNRASWCPSIDLLPLGIALCPNECHLVSLRDAGLYRTDLQGTFLRKH